jgi:hypothetical protein
MELGRTRLGGRILILQRSKGAGIGAPNFAKVLPDVNYISPSTTITLPHRVAILN